MKVYFQLSHFLIFPFKKLQPMGNFPTADVFRCDEIDRRIVVPRVSSDALDIARRIALYKALGDCAQVATWEAIHASQMRRARAGDLHVQNPQSTVQS